jgi:hypothetical protein
MRRFTLAALVLGFALAIPMRASADTTPMPNFMPSPSAYAPVPQTTSYPQMSLIYYGLPPAPPCVLECVPDCGPSCPPNATCAPQNSCPPAPTCDHPGRVPHHGHRR